ncbi:MAG: glycosyltransferase family 39 protein [Candidatus Eisenbacteria bacterium]|uniref:Glycosyltransferase family 39 protein n=1 Tax=Eiseniibacteriota bacterium TaxID=2212470 RepID=A0A9D6QK66_UNCEI|nr:glycosyltransferase family 39 protein [Candidatus Eisenbacteria bacterium]MBI3539990.1 glycosyltransferase family 39 protein [Candidatus Eisenbacteria bacterium]
MSALRIHIAAALAVAAALRLFRLGHQSLWVDEVFSWMSADIGHRWSWSHLLEDVHGPLYSLMLHLWGGIAGDSEWALRLPSAVLGVALVGAIAWVAALWLGRETAVPAAWLAAGSPFLVWYAQEARNYTALMLWVCVGSALLLGLARRLAPARVAGYVAAAGIGVLSNLSFAMMAPVHLRWWLGPAGGRLRRLALAGGVAVLVLAIAAAWVPQIARIWDWKRLDPAHHAAAAETPLRGATTFHAAAIPFAAYTFAVGPTLGPPVRALRVSAGLATLRPWALELAVSAVVFGLLIALGFAAVRRRDRLGDALLWLVLPALVVSYFAMQNFKVFHPRYLAVSVPAFIALLAAAFADLGRSRRVALAALVAALWTVSLTRLYFDPRFAREDMRGAARWVAARAMAGDRIVAANTAELLVYYYRGPVPVTPYWLGYAADARLAPRFEAAAGEAPSVWVVLSRAEDFDRAGAFARYLDQRYPAAERATFEGVRVWHIRRTPPSPAHT